MHDMLQPPGIVLCFASILALEPGGLAHFATVCTSFCWTNSGTHQRTSFNPLGDESKAYIREGSQLGWYHFCFDAAGMVQRLLCYA